MLRGLSVLLIDDDEGFRASLERVFYQHGIKVISVSNSVQAIDMIHRPQGYDVVVCDLKMPGRSGLDILNELRASNYKIPFILMTGFADRRLINEVQRKGAYHIFSKPFETSDLIDIIAEAVGIDAVPRAA
jgi:FixJ family two-component response regulator